MLEFVITDYLHFHKEELAIFLDETLAVTLSIRWLSLNTAYVCSCATNSAYFCSCAVNIYVKVCKCFQVWEIYFPTWSALSDSELHTSIYNICWITFHMYVLQVSLSTFSFMSNSSLCWEHVKWQESVWFFKSGDLHKQAFLLFYVK